MHDPIDELKLTEYTAIGYTQEELAALTGISVDTLVRHYSDAIKRGRSLRNASLRRKQYEKAMAGSDTMLIWLGKQYLGQKDKSEVESKPNDLNLGALPIPKNESESRTIN